MCTVHHLPATAAFLNFTLVWFIIFPRVEQTLYSVSGWKGLNARQACQLFRSVRDMRRRRLAQLLIHDLDITMKTDKSLLLPPVQSLQGCLNSRPRQSSAAQNKCVPPGFHFSGRSIQYPQSINDVIRLQNKTNGCSGARGEITWG